MKEAFETSTEDEAELPPFANMTAADYAASGLTDTEADDATLDIAQALGYRTGRSSFDRNQDALRRDRESLLPEEYRRHYKTIEKL